MATVKWKGPEFVRLLTEHVIKGVDTGSIRLQKEVKRQLARYMARRRRGGARPPADKLGLDTGTLTRSIQVDRRHLRDNRTPRTRVGTNLVYGPVHEFGSRDGNTPKRPFMRPAKRATEDAIIKDIDNRVKRAIREFRGVR